jgi:hypothetical protein
MRQRTRKYLAVTKRTPDYDRFDRSLKSFAIACLFELKENSRLLHVFTRHVVPSSSYDL